MLGKTWARASATAPTTAPITAPVTAPTTGPVTAPTTAPVTEPAAEPAAEPTPARAQNGSAPAPVEDLSRLLADAVSSVLGMPTQELDLSAPLNHLGFDSLMAGQVRAKVKDATGVQLPITRMLSGKSVTELASGLGEQLASPDGGSK
jgi:acyl carrier protein